MECVVLDVLRTPELQRLRRVRQLGLAHFVFPGAEHSRLVHSLGSAHLAIRFAKQLSAVGEDQYIRALLPGDTAIRDVAVAALCHDLGHGPLSHAFEKEVVGRDFNREAWITTLGISAERELISGAKWHEMVGHALLAWEDGQLHKLLEERERGLSLRIRHLLRGKYHPYYLGSLLRGEVDVDRADFIRRDAHQTGVAYGRYDLDWLISTCGIGVDSSNKLVVGFDERKSIRVVEQFLIARRALYETVYYHKTVHCIEGMVALFLRRLRDVVRAGSDLGNDRFVAPYVAVAAGEAVSQKDLLVLDDFSLWVLIDSVANDQRADDTLRDLGRRIIARDLFKQVSCDDRRLAEFLKRPTWQSEVLEVVQRFCPGPPEYYLVYDPIEIRFFAEDRSEWGHFLDSDRRASPFRDHPSLHAYSPRPEGWARLFTLKEATEDVSKMIAGDWR
ncbi:HD domain protein [Phycisphaerae bacterium RAS1]|nr:HD domain protein [Phycisphaerae bacterium RAS1]